MRLDCTTESTRVEGKHLPFIYFGTHLDVDLVGRWRICLEAIGVKFGGLQFSRKAPPQTTLASFAPIPLAVQAVCTSLHFTVQIFHLFTGDAFTNRWLFA